MKLSVVGVDDQREWVEFLRPPNFYYGFYRPRYQNQVISMAVMSSGTVAPLSTFSAEIHPAHQFDEAGIRA